MKICAVICELNPLHNGHAYIFSQARKVTRADAVLALMSGNFVQRALPAVLNEDVRARCALTCGADIVLELPAVYAVAAADRFARGAVGILNTLPNVTHLVMGAETRNAELLCACAEIQANEPQIFKDTLKAQSESGESYARALTEATVAALQKEKFGRDEARTALSRPNNILAIAYKKALIQTNSRIAFTPVPRIGTVDGSNLSGTYSSASAIRAHLREDGIAAALPAVSYQALQNNEGHFPNDRLFGGLILDALRRSSAEEIAATPDCAEGLEHKLKHAAAETADYGRLLSAVSASRYTNGRLMRICLQNLLGTTKSMQNDGYICSRLLGIGKGSEALLGTLPKNIIKTKRDEAALSDRQTQIFAVDRRAADLYSLLTDTDGNPFYRRLPIVE